MAAFRVVLRSGEELFGTVSNIDTGLRTFRLIADGQVGMIGSPTAGRAISFDDCQGVYGEDRRSPNSYESTNQVDQWVAWARNNRL